MNGDQLADILRWGREGEYEYSWYAGQELPKEWWKTNFPYREAEKMGYRLSPEETRKFYERKKKEPKSTSEQIADILSSKDFMMLDPKSRASVIQLGQKIKTAEAEEARAREKHEAEMLEIGRQKQMQEKVQAILESDRVPAQKVTALTLAGVPLSEARKMVWGERAPEEEARRPTKEAAPKARAKPEELAAALRPEEERGVRVREIEGELITEPVPRPTTPEEREEYRLAEEKTLAYRQRRDALEEARKARNAAMYERRRNNIAEANRLEREAEEKEKEARGLRIKEIDLEGVRLKGEKREEETKRLERERGIYERRREAVRPPTRMEELEIEAAERAGKTAEEARLQAKFAPGELHRKALAVLDEAREAENAGIYERRRGNILEAMEKDLERADAEAAARKLLIAEVDAKGVEMRAEKKAEEKERLQRERERWQGVRDNIKSACADELAKEEEKAKERQARIDLIDAKGEVLKTAKEKKEQERLQKLQEKYETTRTNIRKEMEKDEERKEAEREAKEARIKEARDLGEKLADKRYNRKIAKIKYDNEKKKIERTYQDSVIEKGEKKAKDERDYKVKILEKTFNWIKTFEDLGFDNEDLVEIIPEFLGTLDINKEQEEGVMKALGVVGKIAKRNEEEVIADFSSALKEQCQSIDGQVLKEGITEEVGNKIEWVAFLQFALDEKILGHDKAVEKWEGVLKTGYWWLGGAEIPFKKSEAKEAFREKMKGVITEAKTADIMEVAGKLLSEENQKSAEKIAGQFSKEKGREIELPEALRTALVGLGDKDTNYIIEGYKGLFNTKTGKMTKEPSATDRQRALAFVVGVRDDKRFKGEVPDEREKGLLPVNMTGGEFLKALIQESKLSRTQEGWLIWKRFEPSLWVGVENEAGLLGHLLMSKTEDTQPDGILDRIGKALKGVFEEKPETHWFFKPAEKVLGKVQQWWEGKEETKPTEETKPAPEGRDIRGDLRQIVKDHPGIKGREAAIYLKEKGWSDDEIRVLGGAR